MTWVAVAIGGSAALGAGASYLGSKKQAGGSKKAAEMNMEQFRTINAQQMPFIQGGYGALSKLNTLLGLSPRMGGGGGMPGPQSGYSNTNDIVPTPRQPQANAQGSRLRQLLALRAAHGDRDAARMMSTLQ